MRVLALALPLCAAAAAGCAADVAPPPAAATTTASYVCDDGFGFQARFTTESRQVTTGKRTVPVERTSATLILKEGVAAQLEGQPVGSGMHYSGDGYDLRGKGSEATLTSPDGTTRTCRANG